MDLVEVPVYCFYENFFLHPAYLIVNDANIAFLFAIENTPFHFFNAFSRYSVGVIPIFCLKHLLK